MERCVPGPVINCGAQLLRVLRNMNVEPEIRKAFQTAIVGVRTTEPKEAFETKKWDDKRIEWKRTQWNREAAHTETDELGPFPYATHPDRDCDVCQGSGSSYLCDDCYGSCMECMDGPDSVKLAEAWRSVDKAVAFINRE